MWSQFVGLEGVIDKQKLFLFLRRLSINHVAIDRGNFLTWSLWSFQQQVFVPSTPDRSVVYWDAWIKRRLVDIDFIHVVRLFHFFDGDSGEFGVRFDLFYWSCILARKFCLEGFLELFRLK